MAESDFFKNTATGHHETPHGTTVPETHSNDAEAHHPETMHDDEEHGGHEEGTSPTEREVVMNTKTTPTFAALALAIFFAFGSPTGGNAKTTGPAFTNFTAASSTSVGSVTVDFQPSAVQGFDFVAFDAQTPAAETSGSETGGLGTSKFDTSSMSTEGDITGTSAFEFVTYTPGTPTDTGTTNEFAVQTWTNRTFSEVTGDGGDTRPFTRGTTFTDSTPFGYTFNTATDCFGGCGF